MRQRFFTLLTKIAIHHGTAVLIFATLATFISLLISTQLQIKTNFKDLLGKQNPVSIQQSYIQDNFPVVSSVQILIEGLNEKRITSVAHALEARLKAAPDLIEAVYLEQPLDFFIDHSLLYMDSTDLHLLNNTITQW